MISKLGIRQPVIGYGQNSVQAKRRVSFGRVADAFVRRVVTEAEEDVAIAKFFNSLNFDRVWYAKGSAIRKALGDLGRGAIELRMPHARESVILDEGNANALRGLTDELFPQTPPRGQADMLEDAQTKNRINKKITNGLLSGVIKHDWRA